MILLFETIRLSGADHIKGVAFRRAWAIRKALKGFEQSETQFDSRNQAKMSQGNLGVVEIQERKSVPQICRKRKRRFFLLAGALVLIALAAMGVEMRSLRPQPTQQHSNKTTTDYVPL
jgi:hypothetical protein